MDRIRTSRREVIQRERGVVGHDRAARSESEPRRNDVVVGTGWNTDEAIETTADPFEVAGRDVVQEAASAVAQLARLRSSEVSTLRRRQFEEPRELIRPRGFGISARHVPCSIRYASLTRDTTDAEGAFAGVVSPEELGPSHWVVRAFWWRRRESNPRPKTSLRETLQV